MYCPNCGAEVKDDKKFCPKCGTNLNESDQPKNNVNNSTEIKTKSAGILSFFDEWKAWSTPKKAISIIVVCCIGLIIVGAIGGFLSPDSNTSGTRCYTGYSSFILPDDYILSSADELTIFLEKKSDNSNVIIFENTTPVFNDDDFIINSNETIDVDGVSIHKINATYIADGTTGVDYYFNKDNIDYWIAFDSYEDTDENSVKSIVKTMDTSHGTLYDHENVYPNSTSSNNNDHEDLYDSYTGSSSSNSNYNSNSQDSNKNDNLGDSEVQVRITCNGGWSGSIGVGTSSSSYSGNGDKIINLDGSSRDIVSAVIQKDSGGNGKLKVEIIKNGNVKKESSTTAGYGVVTVGD